MSDGMRLAGPAYPIKGRPAPGSNCDASLRKVLDMLDSVPEGHVCVYETGDREDAHLGELSVTSLQARGVAGAVIDGGCRDVELIVREGCPVLSRFTTPQDSTGRWELVAHGDVKVELGGVRVVRGEWIVADADGIVAIPAAIAEDVIAEAEEKVATESQIRGRPSRTARRPSPPTSSTALSTDCGTRGSSRQEDARRPCDLRRTDGRRRRASEDVPGIGSIEAVTSGHFV